MHACRSHCQGSVYAGTAGAATFGRKRWPHHRRNMNEADRIPLRQMLDAANEAIAFVSGLSLLDLKQSQRLTDALVKELGILVEAEGRISEEGRKSLPQVPWALIVEMRNRLANVHSGVNLSVVWNTTRWKLPELALMIEDTLRESQ